MFAAFVMAPQHRRLQGARQDGAWDIAGVEIPEGELDPADVHQVERIFGG